MTIQGPDGQPWGVAWARRPDEGAAPYMAFRAFLSQEHPRSIKALADDLTQSYATLRGYSSRYDWAERARAWDDRVAEREDKATIREAENMRRIHIVQLAEVREMGLKAFKAAAAQGKVPPAQALSAFVDAVKLERLVVGEATERVDVSSKVDLERLSSDEIEQLIEMQRKLLEEAEDGA